VLEPELLHISIPRLKLTKSEFRKNPVGSIEWRAICCQFFMWLLIFITLSFSGLAYWLLSSPTKYTAIVSACTLIVFLGIWSFQENDPRPALFLSVIVFFAGVIGLLLATLVAFLLGDTRKKPPLVSSPPVNEMLLPAEISLRVRNMKTITESVVCARCKLRYSREHRECTRCTSVDDRRLRVQHALNSHRNDLIGQRMTQSAIVIVMIIVLIGLVTIFTK